MARIVREIQRPGLYLFKVFNQSNALMYHGYNESTAVAMKASLDNLEEKRAELARETSSNRSSD